MGYYEIVVESHIERKRLRDFESVDYKQLPEGNTLIFGNLKDQAELFSVLNKIRDMNLKLLSVNKADKKGEGVKND
jgi:hypothetical protein